jgi:hypothetical protein
MRRLVAVVIVSLAVGACGSTRPVHHATPGPTPVAGGCGATSLHRGTLPGWAEPSYSASGSRSTPWPYGVARNGTAVAVVFGFPLRAGTPANRTNKVLWIVRLPRNGSPLTVTARPMRGAGPSVHASWPADSGPGEIYPSYLNVPHAGCWRVTLSWAHHSDSIDLHYRA